VLKNEDWLARGVKNVTGIAATLAGALRGRPAARSDLGRFRRRSMPPAWRFDGPSRALLDRLVKLAYAGLFTWCC
jgi:hypothetical protein